MKTLFTATFFLSVFALTAQRPYPPINPDDPSLPLWVKEMYSENPNVRRVDSLYQVYYSIHPFKKNTYTQYYKHWKFYVEKYTNGNGVINFPSAAQLIQAEQTYKARNSGAERGGPIWSFAGPKIHFKARYNSADQSIPLSDHANIHSIDQSASNSQILYCGGESGGVFKSTDKGNNWFHVTAGLPVYEVRALAIHPSNPNLVLFGGAGQLYKTTDGGISWNITGDASFQNATPYIWDIEFNGNDPNIVFAASDEGLYRSTNAGDTWNLVLTNECISVVHHPTNASIVYTVQYDPTSKIGYFYKSTDTGLNFTIKTNGWFTIPAGNAGLLDSKGGKIAVTAADPDRVYVLMVGTSQSGAPLQLNGFIGIYVSNNAGESWTHPHGQIGAPYDVNSHPNPMTFAGDNESYNQIYYNTTIAASQLNPDKILFGGLSLWRSDDGAFTYTPVGGYVGDVPDIHPDMQEIICIKNSPTDEEVWIANDGGVNYSQNFFGSHVSKCRGIQSGAFWGFDQGWAEDIMVGGRYHNGNGGYYENYTEGEFQALGGGEAPTGYVNYNMERETYYSDISPVLLSPQIDGINQTLSLGMTPNEGYWLNESSRILFDADYWNVMYLGKGNKLYKSIDGGASFSQLFNFGGLSSNKVLWIEQCQAQPDVMYVQFLSGNTSQIRKSTDRGITWTNLTLPQNQRYLFFSVDQENPDVVYLAYSYGSNGNKVYKTTNGGSSWNNITTADLDGTIIYHIVTQAGTNGGVYIACYQDGVFYKNNAMVSWEPYTSGLPLALEPLRMIPFYKHEKIRLGTKNMSIWEASLYESSNTVANFSANFKEYRCPGDTVYFVDHSVATASATYQWSFPGGIPASSTLKNPKVIYTAAGTYDVTLIVTDIYGTDTITKTGFIQAQPNDPAPVAEGFESGGIPARWSLVEGSPVGGNWNITNTAGGYGTSANSVFFNNYWIDSQGTWDDLQTPKLSFASIAAPVSLKFDVAYVPYGGQYSDTLEILVTNDCGESWQSLYIKGGNTLATGPNFTDDVWVPSSSQWRTDSVSLSAYAGNSEVIIAFRNRGHWGQAMYLDNINIGNAVVSISSPLVNQLSVYPNPFTDQLIVSGVELYTECNLSLLDINGKVLRTVERNADSQGSIILDGLNDLAPGIYILKINRGESTYTYRVIHMQ